MLDYQLERLNTRSFEQLVQSLALEVIGKQLIIFGDGPDGGREASFEGPTKYPEGKKQWDGLGIIQAKFRQQPESMAKKNADWAIAQLKAEFKKFKPRRKSGNKSIKGERECPEYYVFATNLSLSSVATVGGKDRIRTILDGFKKSHGLKDYTLWDGDQIRRFLDAQPGIRATYIAWLLPGDVLAEMMKYLEFEKTDFPSTIRRYLESELLDDQFAKLGQGGYTDANAIPLSRVFVDLPVDLSIAGHFHPHIRNIKGGVVEEATASEERRSTFLELFFEEGRKVLRPSANVRPTAEDSKSSRVAGRVVLIGGPGQGKTTVGQFACQLLRAALLGVTKAAYSPEITQALERLKQQSHELPKTNALRYPLRIDLKRLAEALAGEGDFAADSVLDFLVQHISKRTDSDLSKREFRIWLKFYPWLLVLDGLDEVPASSNRNKMMTAIRDFISVEAHQQDADLLVLATTRPQGYSDEFDPGLYWHLPLAPLGASEALTYGGKLIEARHPGLRSRIEELTKSLRRATTNAATVRLMESPLQVTIMLALIEGGGEPPEQRWKLFHDYYDVIYRREKERGTSFSALLGKYEPDIHWLHHRAGWLLQQRNAAAGSTAARLTHSDFEQMVHDRLARRGHDNVTQREALVKSIRQAATDRLVFLVGNTAKEIGFEIRSLQEFMAAEHCFDGSESCALETIRVIAPHPYWRNVLLFASGRIFFERESLIDSLIVICERLNETLTDKAQGFIAAGSRLALSMLKDGVARNQPENSKVLARCAARLLDLRNPNEAAGLAILFQSESREVWKEEFLKRVEAPSDKFPRLAWRLGMELASANNEWAYQTIRTHFPWEHPEASLFLAVTIESKGLESNKLLDLIKEHFFIVSPTTWMRLGLRTIIPETLKKWEPFRQLTSIHHGLETASPLLDGRVKETCNGLRIKGSRSIKEWAALRIPVSEPRKFHPTWLVFHAVSEFARDPTTACLGLQFSNMINVDTQLESKAFTYQFPWQIQACLFAKKDGLSLPQIVSAITTGKLGNADDWSRWDILSRKGVKITHLGFPKEHFSISDENLGVIFESSTWSHGNKGSQTDFEFALALTSALPHLDPKSRIARTLVNLCCFGLNSSGVGWSADDALTVEQFIKCCQKFSIPMTREILVAIVRSSLSDRVKISLVDLVGLNLDSRSWLHMWDEQVPVVNAACAQLLTSVERSDNWPRILGAFSFLPPMAFMKTFTSSQINQCDGQDEFSRQAAMVLHANCLRWEKSSAEMAASTVSIKERYPHQLLELLEFIDSEGAAGTHVEEYLLALIQILDTDTRPHFKSSIENLLVKLVERRPAVDSLPDPSMARP